MEWANAAMGAALGGWAVYRVSRPYFRVRVQCWFCPASCRVDFARRNAWHCPECEQYNGFTSDGDYNWADPDQFRSVPEVGSQAPEVTPEVTPDNGLCRSCNLNQSLKVHQLAKFEAEHEGDYDGEIEAFAAHLEQTYRLCRPCEASLHQALGEQDAQLKPQVLSWKLKLNRQTGHRIQALLQQTQALRRRQTWALLLSLVALVMVGGSLSPSLTAWLGPYARLALGSRIHVSLGLNLIGSALASLSLLWLFARSRWHQMSVVISVLALGVWLTGLEAATGHWPIIRSTRVGSWGVVVSALLVHLYQMLNPQSRRSARANRPYRPNLSTVDSPPIADMEDDTLTQELLTSHTPSQQTDLLARTPPPASLPRPASVVRPPSWCLETSADKSLSGWLQNPVTHAEASLNGGQCDISALSLDGPRVSSRGSPHQLLAGGSVFRRKQYSPRAASEMAFGSSGWLGVTGGGSRPILKPPTFQPKGVTRTSWVAGGYWQTQNPNKRFLPGGDDLSRTSSQSSGFVSQAGGGPFGSSLPNSRTNSLFGGEDRHSVLSAPAFKTGHGSLFSTLHVTRNPSPPVGQSRIVAHPGAQADRDSSFDSDFDRLTQSAFDDLQPKAKSSPIPLPDKPSSAPTPVSRLLERQIHVNCTVQSLLFSLSVVINVGVASYIVWHNTVL